MKIVLFDFETNGKTGSCSVLEAMFRKIEIQRGSKEFKEEILHRFYYPQEDFDFSAFLVHGISIEDIKIKRQGHSDLGIDYPLFFKDDKEVISWLNDVDVLVAHNIAFDAQFLPEMPSKLFYCSMKSSKDTVKATNVAGNIKNPTLQEACTFFEVDFDSSSAHGADYDTLKLEELFLHMAEAGLIPFLNKISKAKDKETLIRTNINDLSKNASANKIMQVGAFSFILTASNLFGDTAGLNIYEKQTGNFFTSVLYKELSSTSMKTMLPEDFEIIEAKIVEAVDNIGGEEVLSEIVSDYLLDNNISVQKSLFDF